MNKPLLKKDKKGISNNVNNNTNVIVQSNVKALAMSKYQKVLLASSMGIDDKLSEIPFSKAMEDRYEYILQQNNPQLTREYLTLCMNILETIHSFGK